MKLSITTLLLILSQLILAQDSWINYTNNNNISDVVEIDEGFWLGSDGGLCYYNNESGEEKYYNRGNSIIPSNRIVDLFYDSNQDLWISTYEGICLISDGEMTLGPNISGQLNESLDGKIIVADSDSLYIQEEGFQFKTIAYPSYSVTVIGLEVDQESGAIYVNVINYFTESYVAEWNDNEWTYLFNEYVTETAMVLDQLNQLWFFSYLGLQYFKEGVWIVIPDSGEESTFNLPKLFVNYDNEIIISLKSDCIREKIWDGIAFEEIDNFQDDCSNYIFIKPSDKDSDLYYGSDFDKGFFSFDSDGPSDFEPLNQSPLFSNNVLNTLHLSDGSHIIIFNERIQQLKSGIWSEIDLPDDLNANIKKGALDENENLWIFTKDFLWSYKDSEWVKISPPIEITDYLSYMDIGKNGDVWIQSRENIARYKDQQWTVFTSIDHDITINTIRDLEINSENGDLWVSTFQGVRQYDGQAWVSYNFEPINHAFGLSSGNAGMYTVTNSGIMYMEDGEIDSIPFPDNGSYNVFYSKIEYDSEEDKIYLAGSRELAIYQNNEWTIYDSSNSGLYTSSNNDIRLDNDGNLWMSGNNGGLCIFNEEGITTLSIGEEDQVEFVSAFKVYPTLISGDYFYVESEKDGKYQIMVSDMSGQILYNQEHQLIQGKPAKIKLSDKNTSLIFVSIDDGHTIISRKIVRINE